MLHYVAFPSRAQLVRSTAMMVFEEGKWTFCLEPGMGVEPTSANFFHTAGCRGLAAARRLNRSAFGGLENPRPTPALPPAGKGFRNDNSNQLFWGSDCAFLREMSRHHHGRNGIVPGEARSFSASLALILRS